MGDFRIALLGAGIFAKETYVPLIEANKDRGVRLTACLSRSAGSVEDTISLVASEEERLAILRYSGTEGEEKFFAEARQVCDAVIIVVPIHLLGKYVERCLSLGLHILSEKPVAHTSADARRLIALYRSLPLPSTAHGRYWHVAENYRLEPAVAYARDLVQSRPIPPKTFALTCIRQQSATSKYAVTEWRSSPQYKGSYVLDGGIHFIALLRTVLGGVDLEDVRGHYEERSVVEVGALGSCSVGSTLGTYIIRYGAFPAVVCRLDVYWDDASLSITQNKAACTYDVHLTEAGKEGKEGATINKTFAFAGLQNEFSLWLDTLTEGASEAAVLSPEEALKDLLAVEALVNPVP